MEHVLIPVGFTDTLIRKKLHDFKLSTDEKGLRDGKIAMDFWLESV